MGNALLLLLFHVSWLVPVVMLWLPWAAPSSSSPPLSGGARLISHGLNSRRSPLGPASMKATLMPPSPCGEKGRARQVCVLCHNGSLSRQPWFKLTGTCLIDGRTTTTTHLSDCLVSSPTFCNESTATCCHWTAPVEGWLTVWPKCNVSLSDVSHGAGACFVHDSGLEAAQSRNTHAAQFTRACLERCYF